MSLTVGSPEIRREIDYVTQKYRIAEWPAHLPSEVFLLAPGSHNKYCGDYALGSDRLKDFLLEMLPDISSPEPRDIVCYCRTLGDRVVIEHVGRYQADGRVKSKWGWGQMFLHPLDYVPACFGDVVFFRRASREELQSLPEMAIQKRRDMFMEKYAPTKK